jgi:hypothetical protein
MLLPFLKLGRLKSLRRGLLFSVALVIVLLLTLELNVRQRVCDIRDWEFASSILTSPKFVSRGPMLLHNANGSCTITWESLSHTSLHLIQPKPPVHSQFTASSIWLGHNIGLMEVPFGCAWNVRSIRDKKCASILILICTPQVYHLQLASCPPLVAFRICSRSTLCLSFKFSVLQPHILSDSARVFIIGDSQRGQAIFEQHLKALSGMGPPPQMLLHLGDTAQRANIDGDWDQRFFRPLMRSNVMIPLLLVQGNHDAFYEANSSASESSKSKPNALSTAHSKDVMVNPSLLSYQGSGLRLPTYFATSLAGVRWIVLDTNIRTGLQLQVSRPLLSLRQRHDTHRSGCETSFKARRQHLPIFALCACTYHHGSSFGTGIHGAIATPTALATKRIHCTSARISCRLCSEEVLMLCCLDTSTTINVGCMGASCLSRRVGEGVIWI